MESTSNLEHLKKRRTSFDSQHIKGPQTLVKFAWEDFYGIYPSLWGETTSKISPLLNFETAGVFVSTFSADYKYPVPDYEYLPCPIQT